MNRVDVLGPGEFQKRKYHNPRPYKSCEALGVVKVGALGAGAQLRLQYLKISLSFQEEKKVLKIRQN